jgi:hypothetical protein
MLIHHECHRIDHDWIAIDNHCSLIHINDELIASHSHFRMIAPTTSSWIKPCQAFAHQPLSEAKPNSIRSSDR